MGIYQSHPSDLYEQVNAILNDAERVNASAKTLLLVSIAVLATSIFVTVIHIRPNICEFASAIASIQKSAVVVGKSKELGKWMKQAIDTGLDLLKQTATNASLHPSLVGNADAMQIVSKPAKAGSKPAAHSKESVKEEEHKVGQVYKDVEDGWVRVRKDVYR